MAKVFTIDFHFGAESYPALITVRSKGDDKAVHVHLFEGLHEIVPEGEIDFTISNGLRRTTESFVGRKKAVVSAIREAVVNHLKETT